MLTRRVCTAKKLLDFVLYHIYRKTKMVVRFSVAGIYDVELCGILVVYLRWIFVSCAFCLGHVIPIISE